MRYPPLPGRAVLAALVFARYPTLPAQLRAMSQGVLNRFGNIAHSLYILGVRQVQGGGEGAMGLASFADLMGVSRGRII